MPEAGSTDTNFEFSFADYRTGLRRRPELSAQPMICVENQVCRMAESSQSPPPARMNVHNSVTSLRSPPSTVRPLARSTILSLSANFMPRKPAAIPPNNPPPKKPGRIAVWPMGAALPGCIIDFWIVLRPDLLPAARATVMAAIAIAYALLTVLELWRGRGDGAWRWPIMLLLLGHAGAIPVHIPPAGNGPNTILSTLICEPLRSLRQCLSASARIFIRALAMR